MRRAAPFLACQVLETQSIFWYNDSIPGRKDDLDMFEAWQLAMMEDYGLTDTNTGLVNRVARRLADSPNDSIDTAEFHSACFACGVDPDSFTQSDLEQLQRKLNELT